MSDLKKLFVIEEGALRARPWAQAVANMVPSLVKAVEENNSGRVLMIVEALKGYLDEIRQEASTR